MNQVGNFKPQTLNFKLRYLFLAALLGVVYYPTFVWMVERWMARDSYFAHGILIPIVSLYWLFKKRKQLSVAPRSSESWGIGLLAAGVLLQIVCSILRVYFLSAFSFVLVLFGAVAYLFGRTILKEIWFPVAFLLLMIPLPLLVISEVTLKMKFFVSEVSVYLINSIGIKAVREGSYVSTPHNVFVVGDPCSGLRSFLAFLCLGLVFAYESKLSVVKRGLLVFTGFPLAILSNIARVFSLGVLGEIYGPQLTTGFVHDASGFVVFIIAFGIFMILRKQLEVLQHVATR